ncbi:hypothetical protein [Streptomyces sp. NPDC056165]|uniref:hypothetical protein n=1 Tax=Streptomyces sp. NPDC056165 TaxID=3345733 RepID=UPI0035DFD3D4
MLPDYLTIEVDLLDRDDLERFVARVDPAPTVIEVRALDGDTLLQAVIVITLSTLPVIRTWLLQRAVNKKATVVSWKGNRIQGYSAEDVIGILEALHGEPEGNWTSEED